MAFDELEKFSNGELFSRLVSVHLPPYFDTEEPSYLQMLQPPDQRLLHHYTDAVGLQGIIQSNCLRASAARYLNDSSEVDYGCSVVTSVIEEWLEKNELNRPSPSPAIRVLELLRKAFDDPEYGLARSANIYVGCFCENENLLSQWRAYGSKGGYSIAFEIEDSSPTVSLAVPDQSWEARLEKVVYDPITQVQRVGELLAQSFKHIRECAPDDNAIQGVHSKTFIIETSEFLSELLLDEIATFKNPAFEEESEWRLVVRPRWIDKSANFSTSSLIKFRESRGYLVPYLELRPPEGQRLPIRAIRYGPSLIRERVEDPLQLFLNSCGFRGVRIDGSELPVIL
jgi:hypothetical protein